ncbi:hypothetical protein K431DRAFT_320677 [Polychaeton citri CBS 116435]|uniref:Adenylyltransferase and sulfurtransferase uba4 n=1 Tax=Polychaeton citri CBS 116435 TaxID=1314669 RepID=A0A9P4Q9V8_9PEZI|nr:hypothetical protein K431DRAFT_320677 [Polychaeton citri CBS 116435]
MISLFTCLTANLPMHRHVAALQQQISATEDSLRTLKLQLQQAEQQAESARRPRKANCSDATSPLDKLHDTRLDQSHDGTPPDAISDSGPTGAPSRWPLSSEEYKRYGRQLIMPEIGLHGQLRLKQARVCIVGVGGLGCPAATYLAGAGVSTLGLVDGDTVEASNLHRQIAHATDRVGWTKVQSACSYLRQLNPLVNYVQHAAHLTPQSALDIFAAYDVVLDCTDHPTSRYLISDACVLMGKPLVSASALKTEGQLIVLNNPPKPPGALDGGPCYRCVFPKPPPAETLQSCGEGGILGPVVGVMGVLQALEAIKVLTNTRITHDPSADGVRGLNGDQPVKPTLLMFSAYSNPQFRSVRMRSRRPDCAVCSAKATIAADSLKSGSLDYVAFCGALQAVDILPNEFRIDAGDFAFTTEAEKRIIIDVRDPTSFQVAALEGSVNIPWTGNAHSWLQRAEQSVSLGDDGSKCYVVCRFGNDSQLAAKALLGSSNRRSTVKDIKGGFAGWRREVDPTWPDY